MGYKVIYTFAYDNTVAYDIHTKSSNYRDEIDTQTYYHANYVCFSGFMSHRADLITEDSVIYYTLMANPNYLKKLVKWINENTDVKVSILTKKPNVSCYILSKNKKSKYVNYNHDRCYIFNKAELDNLQLDFTPKHIFSKMTVEVKVNNPDLGAKRHQEFYTLVLLRMLDKEESYWKSIYYNKLLETIVETSNKYNDGHCLYNLSFTGNDALKVEDIKNVLTTSIITPAMQDRSGLQTSIVRSVREYLRDANKEKPNDQSNNCL